MMTWRMTRTMTWNSGMMWQKITRHVERVRVRTWSRRCVGEVIQKLQSQEVAWVR
ncbi:hypothetical protein CsSME_00031667 [Camellia sinensis var. sinensis]